jgi:linoleoyl-CoA desaturase
MTAIKFVTPPSDEFRRVLRTRVDAYFADRGKSKHWNAVMATKLALYIGGYLGGYALIMLGGFSTPVMFALTIVVGLAAAGIGFNIGHDACHNALSRSSRVNRFWAHAFTLIGAHAYNWRIIHNVIHHGFTNIPYADGDLHPTGLLRYFQQAKNKRPYHRFQHLYAIPLYSLATLVWIFYKDFLHITRDTHCGHKKRRPPAVEYFLLILGKSLHLGMLLVLPIIFLPIPIWQVVVGFVVAHLVMGLSLASVFAVGHLVEDVDMPMADDEGHIHDSWAEHQLKTTANFSTKSRFFFWTVGGLNFQIEHHLFPNVCHVHYPKIAPIVRATAHEFGLPYHEFSSFLEAQRSHLAFLKTLGKQEIVADPVLI